MKKLTVEGFGEDGARRDGSLHRHGSDRCPVREAGTTLVELLVSLAVVASVLVATLLLFDLSSNIARVQNDLAGTQQSLRASQQEMVRTLRMAGRGGLPAFHECTPHPTCEVDHSSAIDPGRWLPYGVAVEVHNDVDGTLPGVDDGPLLVEGSDVLVVRGVFGNIYFVNAANEEDFVLTGDPPTSGTVKLHRMTTSGLPQDLTTAGTLEAGERLLLTSHLDHSIFAVVRLTSVSSSGETATIQFEIPSPADPEASLIPGGRFPDALESIGFVGVLEEYRYFLRCEPSIPGEGLASCEEENAVNVLTRARFVPGTQDPYQSDDANLRLDIADNILDFQVAMGIDRGKDGVILSGPTVDQIDETDDDWLFNSPDEISNAEDVPPPNWGFRPLHFVRVTTVARTDRRDRGYESPTLGAPHKGDPATGVWIEDRNNEGSEGIEVPLGVRTRTITTTVEMRNL